jgi:hypothetical protein
MAFNYSPKVVTDGLVLYVDAANPNSYVSGSTTWRDISRSGNNGILTNGPTYSSASGGSIIFDGVNDYTNLGDIFNFTYSSTFSLSILLKIKFTTDAYRPIISKRIPSSPFTGWEFSIGPSVDRNELYFFIGADYIGNRIEVKSNNANLVTNNIYQLCMTYNGGSTLDSFEFYVNSINPGKSSLAISPGGNPIVSQNLQFPGRATTSQLIDVYNTQIYNRALSPTEILQNYNATKTRFGLT